MEKNTTMERRKKKSLNNSDVYIYTEHEKVDVLDIRCRNYYLLFIKPLCKPPIAQEKWQEQFNIKPEDWLEIYVTPFKVIRDTDVQSLQYKIINRFFPCKYIVSKWYKNVEPICDYCEEVDTIQHYFYYCQEINKLWNSLQNWWLP